MDEQTQARVRNWLKRAQKTKRVFRPNLHAFMGKKYCTKCLRIVKEQKRAAS